MVTTVGIRFHVLHFHSQYNFSNMNKLFSPLIELFYVKKIIQRIIT